MEWPDPVCGWMSRTDEYLGQGIMQHKVTIYGFDPNSKIKAIKALRSIGSLLGQGDYVLPLRQAKDLADSLADVNIVIDCEGWQYEAVMALCRQGLLVTSSERHSVYLRNYLMTPLGPQASESHSPSAF